MAVRWSRFIGGWRRGKGDVDKVGSLTQDACDSFMFLEETLDR